MSALASRTLPRVLLLVTPLAGFLDASAAAQGGPPAPVRVDAVRSETVQERRRVIGDVRAVRRSAVAAREKGVVLELLALEGLRIEEGEVLARQDASRLELELAVLHAQVPPAEAAVREAESDVRRATSDLAALERLAEREAANPKELTDARAALAGAEARRARMQGEIGVLDARIGELRARVGRMEIRAPFAGTVTARRTEIGSWLNEGQSVCDLVSTGALEVWLEVPQEHLVTLARHASDTRVVLDATGEVLELEGWRVVPDVSLSARTFELIGVARDTPALAPGMSVTAEVPTSARGEHLTLSRDALLRNEVGAYVYVVMPGGEGRPSTAVPVQVEVLFHLGERVAVRAGRLGAGARVVVEGNERLYPTAPIEPIESIDDGAGESGVAGGEVSR